MPTIGIIGGGILGLAVAADCARQGMQVTVFEKEAALAQHQTGRNSGVAHSGVYYAPGSLKAELCRRGVELLRAFCAAHDVAYDECGKVIVASGPQEHDRLDELLRRGVANGVPGVRLIDPEELKRFEPNAVGTAALLSPATAIVDFVGVVAALAGEVGRAGGEVRTGARIVGLEEGPTSVAVRTADGGTHRFDHVVACAGLQADEVARLGGGSPDPQIVPFRGEYYALPPERRHLVRGLIYPVPDPRYPFLGVHLTRTVSGDVLIGPNAVLALAKEGYRWRDVDPRQVGRMAASRGFRAMARQNVRTGFEEVVRSVSRKRFLEAARRYVPALVLDDLGPARAGVRAQAIAADGSLLDDFHFEGTARTLHLRNAPSPAATASLAIAERVVQELRVRM